MAYETFEQITLVVLGLFYILVAILSILILSNDIFRNWIADVVLTGLLGLAKCEFENETTASHISRQSTPNADPESNQLNPNNNINIYSDLNDTDVNIQVKKDDSSFKISLTFFVFLLICNFAFFFANIFFIDYTYSLECLSEKYYLCFSEMCFDANSTQTNMNSSSEADENLILCMRYHLPDSIISFTSKMTIMYAIFMFYVHMNRGFVKFMIKSKIRRGLTWKLMDICRGALSNMRIAIAVFVVFILFIVLWNVFILFVNVEFVNIFKLITFLVFFFSNFALSIPFILFSKTQNLRYFLIFRRRQII